MVFNLSYGAANAFTRYAHIYTQIFGTLAASMLFLSGGLVFGYTSVLLPHLKNDTSFPYDVIYDSWIAAISPLAMAIGCLFSGSISDGLGRKRSQMLIAIPYIIGWVIMGFAINNEMMLLGRFITGICTGSTRSFGFIYIGEIIDPKYRLIALFFPTLAIQIGFLLSHIIGTYVYWKTSCFLFTLPHILNVTMLCFLKESPQWLMLNGKIIEGKESYKSYRGTSDNAQKELTLILERCDNQKETSIIDGLRLIFSKAYMKSLFIVFVMLITGQWCGCNTIVFYAQDIFQVTFSGEVDPFFLMIGTDTIRSISCLIYCLIGKFMPRRITFTVCSLACSLILLGLIIYLYLQTTGLTWLGISFIVSYIAITLPLSSITWTFIVELFPTQIRGFSSGLCSAISFVLLFISVKVVPEILVSYGEIAMYASFAVVTLVTGVCLHFMIPETTDRSLQDIENTLYKGKQIVEKNLEIGVPK